SDSLAMLMKSHESRKKVGRLSIRPRSLVLDVCFWAFDFASELEHNAERSTPEAFANRRPTPEIQLRRNQRVKGIEPSCAAWEAAVLPLNYTRVLEVNSRKLSRVNGDW